MKSENLVRISYTILYHYFISMSGDIIVGIDNASLILFCVLIAVELFAVVSENDILLVVGLVLIILLYGYRIIEARKSRTHYEYAPDKNASIE